MFHRPLPTVPGNLLTRVALVLLPLITSDAPGQNMAQEVIPPVTIAGTEFRSMHSDILGEDLDLYINLPGNYRDTSRAFPLICLLDGQWDFTLLQAIYGEQYYDGFLPALVTVAITWSGKNANHDDLRRRDFTPSMIGHDSLTGNAGKFLSCIKDEIIPFIESHYRVTTDRTLMGSSLGGLFPLYAMFRDTGLFHRYVLTSPALGWDHGIIDSIEEDYAGNNTDLPVRLFMGIGGLEEGVPTFMQFVEKLSSRSYPGLDFHWQVIPETGHSGGKAEGYTRGLQAVFARPSLRLDSSVLKNLTGTYRSSPKIAVTIVLHDTSLILRTPDGREISLCAESDHEFYARGIFLSLCFAREIRTNKMQLTIEQYSGASVLTRIE